MIVTGAPGAGKTTVLAGLDPSITVVAEPARRVLAVAREETHDQARFVDLMLDLAIADYDAVASPSGPVVFDRGIPDMAAYAIYFGTNPAGAMAAAEKRRYRNPVLLLPPWQEIYTTDDERRMTFEMTLAFHEATMEAYRRTGYAIVEVPKLPVAERTAFIAASIGSPVSPNDW